MKLSAILIIILAILIGVLPLFFNCQHDGKMLTLENGKQIPMKCYWTARVSIALAVILLAVGVFLGINKNPETLRALKILGIIIGVIVILLPTSIIGVCSHPGASCNLVMKPALIFMGSLVVVINLIGLVTSLTKKELPA
jgi:hypothetical protein